MFMPKKQATIKIIIKSEIVLNTATENRFFVNFEHKISIRMFLLNISLCAI